jgi:hypothetical protein
MADRHRTVSDILHTCDNDHCRRLGESLHADRVAIDDLGYEDVFYPLRHHHRDGLALELASKAGGATLVWGRGDFIYQVKIGLPRSDWPQVDPTPFWRDIRDGTADVDVVVLEVAARAPE